MIGYALRIAISGGETQDGVKAMNKITAAMLVVLSGYLAVSGNAQAMEGLGQQRGFWNIYASIPGGDLWESNYQPQAGRLTRQAKSIQDQLDTCGIITVMANSSWVVGFRPDLVIVISGPFPSANNAAFDLSLARRCGILGYSKFGILNEH